jgi:hypothetical protein
VSCSQSDSILEFMRTKGSITPMVALNKFGCFRLAARISDLRRRGHLINSTIVDRRGKRYAAYSLVGSQVKAA